MIKIIEGSVEERAKPIIRVNSGDVIKVMSSVHGCSRSERHPNIYLVTETPVSGASYVRAFDLMKNTDVLIKTRYYVEIASAANLAVDFK